jgi:endo-1,4-beta-mannosidase
VKALLSIALEQKVKINFALLDFLIDSKPRWFNHVLCGGRGMVFTDSTLRDQFMKSFLMPFLLEFGNHPAILAFNIINEPEWMIDTAEGGDIQSSNRNSEIKLDPIPLRSYKQFVTMCIDTIHIYAPAKLVTVGTSIKFHSLVDSLNVDYFAFHYYTWMDDANGCQLDCVLKSLSYTNKPWILEEFPTVSSEINSLSVYTYFRTVAENGGAGAFLWNWKPGVDNQTYNKNEREDIVRGISSWVNEAGLSGEINE